MADHKESAELVGPKQVTGVVDGSVSIKCMYSTIIKANKYDRKYFCVENGRRQCNTVVSTTNFVMDSFKTRASLIDYPEEGYFIVELSHLNEKDKGTYRCGIGKTNYGLMSVVNVAVIEDSPVPKEAELLYGQIRSSLNFLCEFDTKFSNLRKYLCKSVKQSNCKTIIDSKGMVDPGYEGRILLADGEKPGTFKVKLIQLRKEDAGIYTCGVGENGGEGESNDFDLRINEETDIHQGSRLLTTYPGGSVSGLCHYNPKKNYNLKFWCRLKDQSCNPIIMTDGFVKDSYEGRVVIHDNPVNGTFQILMNGITKEDEGWYWCVMTNGGSDQTFTMQVKIAEAGNHDKPKGLAGEQTVYVSVGKPARIPCSYPCRYTSYEKYWCKWNNYGCVPVTFVDADQIGLSVSCETRELVLNFSAVTQKDEGWYWCGVKKDGKYGETLPVHLIIGEAEKDVYLQADGYFQQDNVLVHKARITMRWFLEHDNDFCLLQWPAQSLDLNPIEHFWDELENAIYCGPTPVESPGVASEGSSNSNALAISLSVIAAVLVVAAVFLFVKLRQKKNSDLVSVGSYRTNISMTELETGPYIGKDNPVVDNAQETDLGSSQDEKKSTKKGSKEDLAYSSFLIHANGKPNEEVIS
ncbi:polymeric immunoglobulin receptor-like [Bombina bombina]|uniref:polymeric immunoglobulin receptor-like n=1 Tax=Bombina bombina TaxID=8345 RepID=UPI00235AE838|nr:polymeric immunoglobulin receptor-like [Bombina bombina]